MKRRRRERRTIQPSSGPSPSERLGRKWGFTKSSTSPPFPPSAFARPPVFLSFQAKELPSLHLGSVVWGAGVLQAHHHALRARVGLAGRASVGCAGVRVGLYEAVARGYVSRSLSLPSFVSGQYGADKACFGLPGGPTDEQAPSAPADGDAAQAEQAEEEQEDDDDQPIFSTVTGTYRHPKRYGTTTTTTSAAERAFLSLPSLLSCLEVLTDSKPPIWPFLSQSRPRSRCVRPTTR